MVNSHRLCSIVLNAASLIGLGIVNVRADEPDLPQRQLKTDVRVLDTQTMPPAKLRGYGTVSGRTTRLSAPSGTASLTEIHCDDQASAKLLCAKYLSDLAVLPGVRDITISTPDGGIAAHEAKGQGCISAGRDDHDVLIVAANSAQDLGWVMGRFARSKAAHWASETQVPMWLDRWDRFCFNHCYWVWQLPKGKTNGNYDFIHEFDYAQQQDRAGVEYRSHAPLATDGADGLMKREGDWVIQEARKRNLPATIYPLARQGSETTWFLNRFRDQTQMKMPGFTGNYHTIMSAYEGGQGVLSWSATTAEDDRLSLLQKTVRRYAADANVTSVMEPHEEMKHGDQDIFMEYGPVADANYQRYLRDKYGSLAALTRRWGVDLKSWEDVHVPEIASFAGWGAKALDVGGIWRIGYEELTEKLPQDFNWYNQGAAPKSKPAPEQWFKAEFDDSAWPTLPGAGHDLQMFTARQPAVFRRNFEVPAGWLPQASGRVWLYVWDMNLAGNEEVRAVMNGTEVGRSKITPWVPHWTAMEVTSAIKPGKNTLAIRLPQGYLAYKTYLSQSRPEQYPDLGEHMNAQWVDFIDFTGWTRVEGKRRGIEMIRQVVPNPGIVLAAPNAYADGVKALAQEYGGEFHDTGFMGANYADLLPSLMRGANLPSSVENGEPAADLNEFKKHLGLWQIEGVNAIDYYIHIGSILWRPDIKAEYEAQRKQLTLLGQSHNPKAEIACFYADRIAQITGFPWGTAYNQNLGSGYWNWNAASVLRGSYPYDALSPSSFPSGDANAYRVIIDSNTSIMDETLVNEIEKWVRAGGTFVCFVQTGRHTPETPDTWPIARLSGYKVSRIDRLRDDGSVEQSGRLRPASDQQVFDASWQDVQANGLHLVKSASDAQNLLMWDDGTVAAGVRPLGKGFIVQLGAKFTGAKIPDRVEPGADSPQTKQLRQMLAAVLKWRDVKPEVGALSPENEQVWLRHAVTNNGLYDTWTVRNWSATQSQTVAVALGKDNHSTFAIEVRSGKEIPVTASPGGARIENIVLPPLETFVYLTPHNQISEAPQAWFQLQRDWWRGTVVPNAKPLPAPIQRFALELTDDWKFKTLSDADNAMPLLGADVNDQSWTARPLGIWNVRETGDKGHGVFRRTFTVPPQWTNGRVSLWLTSWAGSSFVEQGRVWLDGREVKPMNDGAYIAIGLPSLTPGSSHTLAVEARSGGVLAGLRGQCWLSFEPNASERIDLAGQWLTSNDALHWTGPITLPGQFSTHVIKRNVFVDSKYRGKNAVITIDGDSALISVIINGKLVRRHHHMRGERGSLNLTPFVRFGEDNEIELIRWGQFDMNSAPSHGLPAHIVRELSLNFFDTSVCP